MTEIPYDEMRRILGLPDVPFAKGGIITGPPHLRRPRLERGEAIAFHVDGRIRVSIIVDVIDDGDRVTYRLADAYWMQRGGYTEVLKRASATQVITGGAAQRAADREARAARIPRPSHTPPMWANNPARTRRTKHKPTRRVK